MSFVNQCLAGDVDPDAIDDFVARWHEGATGVTIWEFLGMTKDEYALWVEQPDSLHAILYAHRFGGSVEEAVKTMSIAARGADREEARRVRQWLKKSGRLPA